MSRPTTTSPTFSLSSSDPATPEKITSLTPNFSISKVAVIAAFTFPIPDCTKTTSLSLNFPVKNDIPFIVFSLISLISFLIASASSITAPIIPIIISSDFYFSFSILLVFSLLTFSVLLSLFSIVVFIFPS